MLSISRFNSIFGKGLVVGLLGVGLLFGGVSATWAGDDDDNDGKDGKNFVVIGCAAVLPNEPPGTIRLSHISATDQLVKTAVMNLRNPVPQCAAALKYLTHAGYKFAKNVGAVAAPAVVPEVIVRFGQVPVITYTLYKKVDRDGKDD